MEKRKGEIADARITGGLEASILISICVYLYVFLFWEHVSSIPWAEIRIVVLEEEKVIG